MLSFKLMSRGMPGGWVRRGATLLELLIVMALMGILIVAVGYLMRAGHTYYFGSIESLDLQQQSLFGISRISNEICDTNINGVQSYPDPLPTDPVGQPNSGLVFPSPRGLAGNFQYDNAGRILWQTFVCYYITDLPTRKALVKKVVPIPSGPQITVPDPDKEGCDLTFFKNSAAPVTVIGGGVIRFQTTVNADTVDVLTNARVSGRYEFELETQTTVLPRN